MKITIKHDLKAGTYSSDDARVTLDAGSGADAELTLDFQLAPPPVDPPANPEPPKDQEPPIDPPPITPPPVDPDLPFVQPPNGDGVHVVTATVTDAGGIPWTAAAHVGDDPTHAAVFQRFANASGEFHEGLTLHAYADGCLIGARWMGGRYDHVGCTLAVTYDDQPAKIAPSSYADGTVDFWRGSIMPAIRYGQQVECDPARMDRQVLPDYAFGAPTSYDISRMDFRFNGRGCATTPGMSDPGDHDGIGFLPRWDAAYACDPSQANEIVLRAAADHCGVWRQVGFVGYDGHCVNVETYPWATVLSAAQRSKETPERHNPIAPYAGIARGAQITPPLSVWDTTACPNKPESEHVYGYAYLAALVTGSSLYADLASAWANWGLLDGGPQYRISDGYWKGIMRRIAWGLRSLHMGAHVSSDRAYFQRQLDFSLGKALAWLPTADGHGEANLAGGYFEPQGTPAGTEGVAMWQQSYLTDVIHVIAKTDARWAPIRDYLFSWYVKVLTGPWAMYATNYFWITWTIDAAKNRTFIGDWKTQVRYSIPGAAKRYTEDELDRIMAATKVSEAWAVYQEMIARTKTLSTLKCEGEVADFTASPDPGGYAAEIDMVVTDAANAGVPGAAEALAYVQAVPTPVKWDLNRKFQRAANPKYSVVP